MENYLKIFKNQEAYNEYIVTSEPPKVSHLVEECEVNFNTPKDYSKEYLTFIIKASGNIKWSGSTTENTLSYSKDDGETWTTVNSADTISVSEGDKVMWKGTPTPYQYYGIGTFSGESAVIYDVEGNAMSLLYGDDFNGKTSLTEKEHAFYGLFRNNTNVESAEHMLLIATTLGNECYAYMFASCASLTITPIISATTLADYCCEYMFFMCSSLTTAPSVLPATSLTIGCYDSMFGICTSLIETPELPATIFEKYCYRNMFSNCASLEIVPSSIGTSSSTMAVSACTYMFANCTSLTTVPELPATTLAESCYQSIFQGCTALTTVPSFGTSSTTMAISACTKMFANCTSLTTAPELLANTLNTACYSYMFSGCTALTTAPELSVMTLKSSCYYGMFQGCTSLTTAPVLPATALTSNCYRNMFTDCSSLNYIKAMFRSTPPSTQYTGNWVNGVASSGTFVRNSSSSWSVSCGVNTYPCGWTVERASS